MSRRAQPPLRARVLDSILSGTAIDCFALHSSRPWVAVCSSDASITVYDLHYRTPVVSFSLRSLLSDRLDSIAEMRSLEREFQTVSLPSYYVRQRPQLLGELFLSEFHGGLANEATVAVGVTGKKPKSRFLRVESLCFIDSSEHFWTMHPRPHDFFDVDRDPSLLLSKPLPEVLLGTSTSPSRLRTSTRTQPTNTSSNSRIATPLTRSSLLLLHTETTVLLVRIDCLSSTPTTLESCLLWPYCSSSPSIGTLVRTPDSDDDEPDSLRLMWSVGEGSGSVGEIKVTCVQHLRTLPVVAIGLEDGRVVLWEYETCIDKVVRGPGAMMLLTEPSSTSAPTDDGTKGGGDTGSALANSPLRSFATLRRLRRKRNRDTVQSLESSSSSSSSSSTSSPTMTEGIIRKMIVINRSDPVTTKYPHLLLQLTSTFKSSGPPLFALYNVEHARDIILRKPIMSIPSSEEDEEEERILIEVGRSSSVVSMVYDVRADLIGCLMSGPAKGLATLPLIRGEEMNRRGSGGGSSVSVSGIGVGSNAEGFGMGMGRHWVKDWGMRNSNNAAPRSLAVVDVISPTSSSSSARLVRKYGIIMTEGGEMFISNNYGSDRSKLHRLGTIDELFASSGRAVSGGGRGGGGRGNRRSRGFSENTLLRSPSNPSQVWIASGSQGLVLVDFVDFTTASSPLLELGLRIGSCCAETHLLLDSSELEREEEVAIQRRLFYVSDGNLFERQMIVPESDVTDLTLSAPILRVPSDSLRRGEGPGSNLFHLGVSESGRLLFIQSLGGSGTPSIMWVYDVSQWNSATGSVTRTLRGRRGREREARRSVPGLVHQRGNIHCAAWSRFGSSLTSLGVQRQCFLAVLDSSGVVSVLDPQQNFVALRRLNQIDRVRWLFGGGPMLGLLRDQTDSAQDVSFVGWAEARVPDEGGGVPHAAGALFVEWDDNDLFRQFVVAFKSSFSVYREGSETESEPFRLLCTIVGSLSSCRFSQGTIYAVTTTGDVIAYFPDDLGSAESVLIASRDITGGASRLLAGTTVSTSSHPTPAPLSATPTLSSLSLSTPSSPLRSRAIPSPVLPSSRSQMCCIVGETIYLHSIIDSSSPSSVLVGYRQCLMDPIIKLKVLAQAGQIEESLHWLSSIGQDYYEEIALFLCRRSLASVALRRVVTAIPDPASRLAIVEEFGRPEDVFEYLSGSDTLGWSDQEIASKCVKLATSLESAKEEGDAGVIRRCYERAAHLDSERCLRLLVLYLERQGDEVALATVRSELGARESSGLSDSVDAPLPLSDKLVGRFPVFLS